MEIGFSHQLYRIDRLCEQHRNRNIIPIPSNPTRVMYIPYLHEDV